MQTLAYLFAKGQYYTIHVFKCVCVPLNFCTISLGQTVFVIGLIKKKKKKERKKRNKEKRLEPLAARETKIESKL